MNVLVAVTDLGLRALWEGILRDRGHRTLPISPNLPEVLVQSADAKAMLASLGPHRMAS